MKQLPGLPHALQLLHLDLDQLEQGEQGFLLEETATVVTGCLRKL